MQGEMSQSETCLVFRGKGDEPARFQSPQVDTQRMSRHPSAAAVPLRQIMSRRLICARPDLDVRKVVDLLMEHHIGCLPVVDERQRPVGMITKHDLIDQIHATASSVQNGSPLPADLEARCADEIMMPFPFTLRDCASVAHAASLMIAEDTHHVIVVGEDDRIAGIVSSRDIVAWLLETDGP